MIMNHTLLGKNLFKHFEVLFNIFNLIINKSISSLYCKIRKQQVSSHKRSRNNAHTFYRYLTHKDNCFLVLPGGLRYCFEVTIIQDSGLMGCIAIVDKTEGYMLMHVERTTRLHKYGILWGDGTIWEKLDTINFISKGIQHPKYKFESQEPTLTIGIYMTKNREWIILSKNGKIIEKIKAWFEGTPQFYVNFPDSILKINDGSQNLVCDGVVSPILRISKSDFCDVTINTTTSV